MLVFARTLRLGRFYRTSIATPASTRKKTPPVKMLHFYLLIYRCIYFTDLREFSNVDLWKSGMETVLVAILVKAPREKPASFAVGVFVLGIRKESCFWLRKSNRVVGSRSRGKKCLKIHKFVPGSLRGISVRQLSAPSIDPCLPHCDDDVVQTVVSTDWGRWAE